MSELDLPAFDYTAPEFPADRYRQQLAENRQGGWPVARPYPSLSPNHGLAPGVS